MYYIPDSTTVRVLLYAIRTGTYVRLRLSPECTYLVPGTWYKVHPVPVCCYAVRKCKDVKTAHEDYLSHRLHISGQQSGLKVRAGTQDGGILESILGTVRTTYSVFDTK